SRPDPTGRGWEMGQTGPEKRAEMAGHTGAVMSVAFSADGKTLASASADETLRLWAIGEDKAKKRFSFKPHGKPLTAVAFAPEGGVMATAGHDSTVRLWNVSTLPPREPGILQSKHGMP